jgi:F0F1-type ATP synthase membrane subunit b/b'
MIKNKITTAAELEKQARETQADAARIREKAAKERKKLSTGSHIKVLLREERKR